MNKRRMIRMMNINEIITVFRVECRCIYTGGSKTQTIYKDDMIIINNFETALYYYDYMLKLILEKYEV